MSLSFCVEKGDAPRIVCVRPSIIVTRPKGDLYVARDGPAPVDLVDAKEFLSRTQWPTPAVVLALTGLHLSVRLLGHLETCIDEVVQNPVR